MKFYTFDIVIEKEPEDAGYFAHSPQLPGCYGAGDTIEETVWSVREAITLHVESMIAHGEAVPEGGAGVVRVEQLTVGIPA